MQHFNSNMGEYPEGHPKPPFNCTAIGHADEPVGQPKWQLRGDGSVEILHPRYRKLAVGGWRNEVCTGVCMLQLQLLVPQWHIAHDAVMRVTQVEIYYVHLMRLPRAAVQPDRGAAVLNRHSPHGTARSIRQSQPQLHFQELGEGVSAPMSS